MMVKLYFKRDQLAKLRADAILYLMQETLGAGVAVLDTRAAKLIRPTVDKPRLSLLLSSEAAAFVSIWEEVGRRAV
jgi:hypothetical protein